MRQYSRKYPSDDQMESLPTPVKGSPYYMAPEVFMSDEEGHGSQVLIQNLHSLK